jgi:hypothetical protein
VAAALPTQLLAAGLLLLACSAGTPGRTITGHGTADVGLAVERAGDYDVEWALESALGGCHFDGVLVSADGRLYSLAESPVRPGGSVIHARVSLAGGQARVRVVDDGPCVWTVTIAPAR